MSAGGFTPERARAQPARSSADDVADPVRLDRARATPRDENSDGLRITMGLGGYWKVGFPTRLRLNIQPNAELPVGWVQVETVDGDGVQVVYASDDWRIGGDASSSDGLEVYVPHGRAYHPIRVRLVDQQGVTLWQHTLTEGERGRVLPATQPWVVTLFNDMNFAQAASRSVQGDLDAFSTSLLIEPEGFPRESRGYSGIDLMAISTLRPELIEKLQASQGTAVREWVQGGGRAFLSMGKSAEALRGTGWIEALLSARVVGKVDGVLPDQLEQWLGSQKPLRPMMCAQIEDVRGNIELWLQTPARQKIPVFFRGARGLGQIVVLGTDLDDPQMMQWPDRKGILDRVLKGAWEQSSLANVKADDEMASLGFEDLTGQLRASLDVFAQVKQADLTLLAIVLTVFLVMVGPLDYYLWVRWRRLPGATWITLGLISCLMCLAIGRVATQWKPIGMQSNELTVWDLDYDTQMAHGRAWKHIYSGAGGRYQVNAEAKAFWSGGAAVGEERVGARVSWLGLPGKGLGGFDSSVVADRGMSGYRVVSRGAPAATSTLEELGVPTAGTKALQAEWTMPCRLDAATNQLKVVASANDYLAGQWTNPLQVDLLDAVLVYRGMQYPLPSRFRPGQSITLTTSTISKDFTRQLQRRRMIAGTEKGTPWDPMQRDDLNWLCEIMSFHRAAGGSTYTGLSHRYLFQQDLSELLRLDRAIVFGKIETPMLEWTIADSSNPVGVQLQRQAQWVRLILPLDAH